MRARATTADTMPGGPPDETIIAGLRDLAWRALWILAGLTALTAAIVAIGNSYGERLVTNGLSTNPARVQIVIGNDVLGVPENMIRRDDQRAGGVSRFVDLKIHWPERRGFAPDLVEAFADTDPATTQMVIMRLMRRQGFLDMPARLGPIYLKALDDRAHWRSAHGLTIAPLRADLGFVDEVLVFSAPIADRLPAFIARCQHPMANAEPLLLACETDLFVGESLEARIRFPAHFVRDWELFDRQLRDFMASLLVTSRP